MDERTERRSRFERLYTVFVLFKAFDGTVEALAGLILLVAPMLAHAVLIDTAVELAESGDLVRQTLAGDLIQIDGKLLTPGLGLVIAFLLAHGLVKIATAIALLRRIRRAYPWAIGVLAALTVLQVVTVVSSPGAFGIAILVLDLAILALVIREYRILRAEAPRKGARAGAGPSTPAISERPNASRP